MKHNTQIVDKPESVSWNQIHEVLWNAHAQNREKGINMAFPALPGEKIREKVEGKGKMFVAIDNNKLIGTAAVISKTASLWCGKQEYAYICFIAVIPEYKGQGIYKALSERLENEVKRMGLSCMMFDTHEHNYRMLGINKKHGYKPVDISVWKDHYNVIMVKWLDGRPYSDLYCKIQYLLHRWYKKLRFKPGRVKRFGI